MRRLGLLAFLVIMLSSCMSELHHDLSENEANEMIHLLQTDGITAVKSIDQDAENRKWMVRVRRSQLDLATECLIRSGVPRVDHPTFDDMFTDSGLIPTSMQENARFVNALAGEISATLQRIDGVIEARVLLVVPDLNPQYHDLYSNQATRPSASVLLKTDVANIPSITDSDICRLVAASVQNLEPERVIVVRSHSMKKTTARTDEQHLSRDSPYISSRIILKLTLALLSFVSLTLLFVSLAWNRSKKTIASLDQKHLPVVSD